MKKCLLFFFFTFTVYCTSQELILEKGTVINKVVVNDSISENFSLYLPTNFQVTKKWPIIFVFDLNGNTNEALSRFKSSAEEEGYILAASNNVRDSLSISENVYITSRMINKVYSILPIKKNRSYAAGFSNGARMASLMPTFIQHLKGVISCGLPIANIEILNPKKTFHFIGIVGNEDFNYNEMLSSQKVLNKLKFPNYLLFFNGGHQWPAKEYLSKALNIFTLSSMASGDMPKDKSYIEAAYQNYLDYANTLISKNPLFAYKFMREMNIIFKPLKNVDALKEKLNKLRKSKEYRSHNRKQNTVFFKEALIKEDYRYSLEEDVFTYNYNNLGWWKYQINELNKYTQSSNTYEKQMGKRLNLFVNDLIADNIDMLKLSAKVDEEALNFLWMLSTLTSPKNYKPYLKVISYNSKIGDYDTALFYVEELLKNGYTNQDELYSLENTALLRITPEFNNILLKYFKSARYDSIEQ